MNTDRDLEHDFEAVKLHFVAEWEEGKAPKLPDYVKRYPQFAGELTDFVLLFTSVENASQRVTQLPDASAATLNRIEEIVARTSAPVHNLTEAHKALGWSLARFARELNVPPKAAMRLARGLREWPEKLEEKLSAVLARPLAEVHALLQNTRPLPATQYKASGQPQNSKTSAPSWQEVLEECARDGDLTETQRQEWIEGL